MSSPKARTGHRSTGGLLSLVGCGRTPLSRQVLRETPSQPAPRPGGSKRTPASRLVSVNMSGQAPEKAVAWERERAEYPRE
ncbi:hypothetical protein SKAU_G00358390 [Synaphobranchus kaupii]|uniref:Uncharacterized protein n=1 Tax=Synaphobranchus kaupii TaxID=118154 RepID=A0A9Q1EHS5_SYNKA|nr:hypothetical protein SKAU_G00358390 [Synaphobranchus kaupii]